MEITEGMDLKVPGLPFAPPITQMEDPGPPLSVANYGKYRELLAGSSWACPRRVQAAASGPRRGKSPGPQARGWDVLQRLPSWRIGLFLWGKGSGEPRSSGPTAAAPARGRQALGWPGRFRGRAYLLLRRWNPRRRGPAALSPAVAPATAAASSASRGGGAANYGTRLARSIVGGKAGALGGRAEDVPRGGSEAGVGCGPVSAGGRILRGCVSRPPLHDFPFCLSHKVAPVAVPGSGDEPEAGSTPNLKELISQGKRTPHEITVSVVFAGKIRRRYSHFLGVTQGHLRTENAAQDLP